MTENTDRGAAARLVTLLKLIAQRGQAFSLKDLATRAGLPQSTVHRLLHILVASGMIERGERQTYKPGRELFRMAALLRAQFDLGEAARPFLHSLWSRLQETCVLCVYNPTQRNASVVDTLQTPHPLRFAIEIGTELSLPWGSLGRSILAELDDEERQSILANPGAAPISGRQLTPGELDDELIAIRSNGYARYYDPGFDISGVASAIIGRDHNVIGCIGVTMPSHRFLQHDLDEMTELVLGASRSLNEIVRLNM